MFRHPMLVHTAADVFALPNVKTTIVEPKNVYSFNLIVYPIVIIVTERISTSPQDIYDTTDDCHIKPRTSLRIRRRIG